MASRLIPIRWNVISGYRTNLKCICPKWVEIDYVAGNVCRVGARLVNILNEIRVILQSIYSMDHRCDDNFCVNSSDIETQWNLYILTTTQGIWIRFFTQKSTRTVFWTIRHETSFIVTYNHVNGYYSHITDTNNPSIECITICFQPGRKHPSNIYADLENLIQFTRQTGKINHVLYTSLFHTKSQPEIASGRSKQHAIILSTRLTTNTFCWITWLCHADRVIH